MEISTGENDLQVLMIGKKGVGKSTGCHKVAKPKADVLNGWTMHPSKSKTAKTKKDYEIMMQITVTHAHQWDELTEDFMEKFHLIVVWIDTADVGSLADLDSAMRVVRSMTDNKPRHYLARLGIVLCARAAENEVTVDKAMIEEFCQTYDWCEFDEVSLQQWEPGSVEAGFERLFVIGQDLLAEITMRGEMKEIFGLIDTDGGGSIDKDEFYELMCMVGMGELLTREESDQMIDKVDGDGSGEVELDEFIAVMTKKAEHENTRAELLQAFEFLGLGGGTHGLPYGEARLDKIGMWLELFKPKDAKASVADCLDVLSRSEKEPEIGPGGKFQRVINFVDFVEINS